MTYKYITTLRNHPVVVSFQATNTIDIELLSIQCECCGNDILNGIPARTKLGIIFECIGIMKDADILTEDVFNT